ncbi:hypothetical protein [Brucella anthropi]|uniref:hypothetical protein n=1 Tax=Brucella anthropi TaxID=529 RepID=UPI003D98ED3E
MSRHGSIAEQLAPLMAYRNRPQEEYESLRTNWNLTHDNDNYDEGDEDQRSDIKDFHIERRINIRPTLGEIEREIAKAEYIDVPYCEGVDSENSTDFDCGSRGALQKSYPYPVSGDIEFGIHIDRRKKPRKVITRIGRLRFSNGHVTERAYTRGPDGKVIALDAKMPVGAMLGTSENQERVLGGNRKGVAQSNAYFAELLEANLPNKMKTKKRQRYVKVSKEETRADLAKAYANTPSLPPVKRCPPGFPWQPSTVAELFMGMKKFPKGQSGSILWQDISTAITNRQMWEEVLAELSREEVATLDAALTSRSFAEVGEKLGMPSHFADKKGGGKRRLLAANENLANAIKKFVA